MSKCTYYGTVSGCGRCEVNITSTNDLRHIKALSIAMITLDLLKLQDTKSTYIDPTRARIQCNGIIVPRRARSTSLTERTYSSILSKWVSVNSCSSIVSDKELSVVKSYADLSKSITDSTELRKVAEELVSVLSVPMEYDDDNE